MSDIDLIVSGDSPFPPWVRDAVRELVSERDVLREMKARVEALAHDWPCGDEYCDGDDTGCAYADELRAVLPDPAPAVQHDDATDGEGA